MTTLLTAVNKKDYNTLKSFLFNHHRNDFIIRYPYSIYDIYQNSEKAMELLKLAINSQNFDIVRILVNTYRYPISDYINILKDSIQTGNVEVFKLVLTGPLTSYIPEYNNYEVGLNLLKSAIENRNLKIVKILLGYHLDYEQSDYISILEAAIRSGDLEIFKFLFNNYHGSFLREHQNSQLNVSLIKTAINENQLPILQYLMDTGRFNPTGVFQFAITRDKVESMKYLLTSYNIIPTLNDMLLALKFGNLNAFKYLLNLPNYKNIDLTPILIKSIENYSKNDNKKTQYFIDHEDNYLEIIELLLQHPKVKPITINPKAMIKHPKLLREFLLQPMYFNKYRRSKHLQDIYTQAVETIPIEMEEALLDTQPGTLKDLVRHQIIRRNLDNF